MEKAIALGADFVEFDVQQTRDGHLVIIHDKRVDRTTDGRGYVTEMSLDQVRKLKAGDGRPIPLFEEVTRVANGRAGVIIEIKTEGIAERVCAKVQESGFTGPVIFASFLHAELLQVRNILETATTMAMLKGVPIRPTLFAADAKVSHVGLALGSITKTFVNALRSEGFRVFVYTVNDPFDIQWVKSLGVDGIISDFPERI